MATSLEDIKARMGKAEDMVTDHGVSTLIYGKGGMGKTSIFYDAEDSCLLDGEGGAIVLKKASYYKETDTVCKPDIFRTKTWEDVQGIFAGFRSGGLHYKNIIIDSLTSIRELCIDHVLENDKRNRISPDVPSQQDWNVVTARMRSLIRNFQALESNVIFICREHEIEDKLTGEVDHRPAIGGKLEEDLPGMMDIVSYMAVSKENDRVAFFNLSGRYHAKDRTNSFPDKIVNPTWEDFANVLVPKREKQRTA